MENLFRSALDANAYQDVRHLYKRSDLVDTCNRIRPTRLEAVKSYLAKEGKQVEWGRTSSGRILDYVYWLDAVIAPAGLSSPKRFGFDITTDTQSTRKKLRRTDSMWDLWKAIGLTQFAVVVLTVHPDRAASCYRDDFPPDDVLERVRDFIDEVVYAVDELGEGISPETPFTLIL
jgi:hypothetical protein